MIFLRKVFMFLISLIFLIVCHYSLYDFEQKENVLREISTLRPYIKPSFSFQSKRHEEFVYE